MTSSLLCVEAQKKMYYISQLLFRNKSENILI